MNKDMNIIHRYFRIVSDTNLLPVVEELLIEQGFVFEKSSIFPFVRKLIYEPFPLGSSIAAKFGYIYIQDRSSMLPVYALKPLKDSSVLDVCASPGSKTGLLGQIVGKNGFVLGNEPSKNRLATLRANLSRLNLIQCSTISYSGESLPFKAADNLDEHKNGWDYVLLDPPCSGWGTVEKNPQVLSLWQGDKLKNLINLQRACLKEAFRITNVGGYVVYSTCTTNIQENEEQVEYACNELGFTLVEQDIPEEIKQIANNSRLKGCWSLPVHEEGQGFFIALLKKTETIKNTSENLLKPNESDKFLGKQKKSLNKKYTENKIVNKESFMDSLASIEGLPENGFFEISGNTVYYKPFASNFLLPDGCSFRGFPLASSKGFGSYKFMPYLHCLMPKLCDAGEYSLVVDNANDIYKLISGQTFFVDSLNSEAGLYYKDLPLCRVGVKKNRILMPALI